MKRAAFVTMATLVLALTASGVAIAQSAPFGEEMHVFDVEDEVYPPSGCETLFVGSSSFRFWFNLKQDFGKLRILKRGFGGAQISDIDYRFDQVVGRYRPERIAFYAGENDIAAGKSPDAVFADFTNFMDRKSAVLGATPVFFVSAKPSIARWDQFASQSRLNSMIERLSLTREDLVYVDIVDAMLKDGRPDPALFISDGLHMKAAGYTLWHQRLSWAFRHSMTSRAPGC